MNIKYAIGFSGGYDSSFFLKNVCYKKQAYKYIIVSVFKHSETIYAKTHFKIAQIAYEWNIAFKIIHTGKRYKSKAKNRNKRLYSIYNYLKTKKISKLYILLSHTDVIETFIMRILQKTGTYGLCSIYCFEKIIFYKCFKIKILYPQIEKTRKEIINNTYRICADYSNKKKANKRNIIREKINIGKYYTSVVYFILFLKALDVMQEYKYCKTTQILKTTLQNNYCLNSDDLKNIILKGTKILYFQTNNTVKKNKINICKNLDINKCHVNTKNNIVFIKLIATKVNIERLKYKTTIMLNYIHKIEIYHPKLTTIFFEEFYNKKVYKELNKCFQKNIKIIIKYKKYTQNIKINNLSDNNYNICNNDQIHIKQIVIQKNFYA